MTAAPPTKDEVAREGQGAPRWRCRYCNRGYATAQSLSRHERHQCGARAGVRTPEERRLQSQVASLTARLERLERQEAPAAQIERLSSLLERSSAPGGLQGTSAPPPSQSPSGSAPYTEAPGHSGESSSASQPAGRIGQAGQVGQIGTAIGQVGQIGTAIGTIGTAIGTQLNLQVVLPQPPSGPAVRPWGTPESLRVTADQLRSLLLESEEVRRYLGLSQASRDIPENGERFAVAAILELVDRVKSDPANENVWLDAGNTSQIVAVTPLGLEKLPFTDALEIYSSELPRQARRAAASADPPLAQSEHDAISDLGMLCDPPPETLARPLKAHLANQVPARRAERRALGSDAPYFQN